MKRIGMLAAVAAAAAIVVGNGGAAIPKLQAVVSDPVNISLTFGGKKVTSLKAGKYTIVVRDTAGDHDFHLSGPGLNRSTTVGGTGTSTRRRWMEPRPRSDRFAKVQPRPGAECASPRATARPPVPYPNDSTGRSL